MESNTRIKIGFVIATIMLPFVLLKFWQFTIIFLTVGAIAAIIIDAIIGQKINFLFILFIEYLFIVVAIFVASSFMDRQKI
jgi:hypothetical protein